MKIYNLYPFDNKTRCVIMVNFTQNFAVVECAGLKVSEAKMIAHARNARPTFPKPDDDEIVYLVSLNNLRSIRANIELFNTPIKW